MGQKARLHTLTLALLAIAIVAGCGQKGPLVLPQSNQQANPNADEIPSTTNTDSREK